MKIFRNEFIKSASDKIVYVFIILSLLVNFGVLILYSSYRDSTKFINGVIAETGAEITPESLKQMKAIAQEKYDSLAKSFKEKYKKEPQSIDEIFMYMSGSVKDGDYYTTEIENYNTLISMIKNAETQLLKAGTENENAGYFTSPGVSLVNELLYSKLLILIYIEMSLLGAYMVLKSVYHEFNKDTQSVIFSTKTGRSLQGVKLYTGLVSISAIYWFISLLSLTAYFIFYRMDGFLNLPISLAGINTPYSFTVITYLIVHLLIGYLLVIVFSLLSFALALQIKNQYMGLVAYLGITTLMFILSIGAEENSSPLMRALAYNPVTLLVNLGTGNNIFTINTDKWFVSGTGLFTDKNSVLWVASLCAALSVTLAAVSSRIFRKKTI